jgi:tetratricopeptide (TPR) repeat protein
VVAAGWAVTDDAAKGFACKFYECMLGGDSFGRALKAARIYTHENFDSNTWGAYQAYGDPDYRLDPAGSGPRSAGLDQVDVAEFIEAVNDIGRTTEAGTGEGRSLSTAVKTLDALVRECPADWLAETDVQMAIGYAYGRLKQFDVACRYLETALAGEGDTSTTTMLAVEKLANFESRYADEIAAKDADRASELYESAIERLERLLAVAKTAERYNLLGGAYKRRAAAETTARAAKRKAARASENYRQAHVFMLQRQGLDPYPTLNWLTLATLLDEQVPDADALIERCEATAHERFSIDRSFFTAVAFANVELVRAFRSGRLGQKGHVGDQEVIRLQERFGEIVNETAPTADELDTVCTQIDIIGRLLDKMAPGRQGTQPTVARLVELRSRIGCDDGAGSPAQDQQPAG